MPIDFRIDDGIGIYTTVGDVDYQEGISVLNNGLDKLNALEPVLILFDIRKTGEHRTPEEIRDIAEIVRSYFSKKIKIALVAQSDLYYGLSRIFAAYVEDTGVAVQVFKKYDDSLAWLKQ